MSKRGEQMDTKCLIETYETHALSKGELTYLLHIDRGSTYTIQH